MKTIVGRLLADPMPGRAIGHQMRLVVGIAAAAAWLFGVALILGGGAFYPPVLAAVDSAALLVPIVGLLASRRSAPASLRWGRALVIIAAAVRVVECLLIRQPAGDVDNLALTYQLTLAMAACGVVFLPAVGLPIALVNLGGLVVQRVRVVGVLQGVGEVGYLGAASLAGFVVISSLRREFGRVEQMQHLAQRRRLERTLSQERIRLRERWDALIHDTVLAALTLASRADERAAAPLAATALDELSGRTGEGAPPVEAIRAHARRLGLDVAFTVPDWLDGTPGEALQVATCEALTNVARHSGQRAATVTSYWTHGVFSVVVADQGRGFDPATVPERRLGLRTAVHGAMHAVGGDAAITSVAGRGTQVILRAAPVEVSVGPEPVRYWRLASLAWISVLFAMQIGSGVAVGSLYLNQQLNRELSLAGMIAIPTLTALLAVVPVRRPWWPLAVLSVGLLWAVLLGNVRDVGTVDWRLWFVGCFNSAVIVVALRGTVRHALALIAGATSAGLLILWWRGDVAVVPVLQATFQTVASAAITAVYRRYADHVGSGIADAALEQSLSERAARLAEARSAEIVRHQQELATDVTPMLRRIAAGEPLADAERARCALLESSTRDELVAGTVLTADLRDAIRAARERGARVSIVGRVPAGASVREFSDISVAMLDQAQRGDRVQLVWREATPVSAVSACLVGVGAGTRWRGPASADHLTTSVDDDSVLIEFHV